MNIRNFFKKTNDNQIYSSSFKRSSATMIDMLITIFLRAIAMQLMGTLWINQQILNFAQEVKDHFGTDTLKNTPEHINFLVHHTIFLNMIIFYLITFFVGAIYHIYLNSSNWQATIGKRIMGIVMIQENEHEERKKINLKTSSLHYFLSILPFMYVIYLIAYQIYYDLSLLNAMLASETNVFLAIVFIGWVQIHVFTKKKTTAYDMICKTNFINGRTSYKTPW